MNEPMIQILVLAGIAVFLVLKLKDVLGTREGFEPTQSALENARSGGAQREDSEPEDLEDHDITDFVPAESPSAAALHRMKEIESSFMLGDFLRGAKSAYEMILMSFEQGELADIRAFLSDEVYGAFASVVESREQQGLTVEAEILGVSGVDVVDARINPVNNAAEITVRFTSELTSVVRDRGGNIVEGSASQSRRQKDVWTFSRVLGADDPNWQLVATGE